MAKKKPNPKLRGLVILRGFGADGSVKYEELMTVDDYYDSEHKILDQKEFRVKHAIRKVTGVIHDWSGIVSQQWVAQFSDKGEPTYSRAEFADGTVQEHGKK